MNKAKLFGSIATLLLAFALPPDALGQELPKVKVSNTRRVFHNGEHNAFTDLIKFGNHYYLTFRSCPDGHMVHPTSSIIVLQSENLDNWKIVHRFSVKHRDTRDPHFLAFRGKLFVYTGTWYSGEKTLPRSDYDLNKHLGYGVHTSDGTNWSEPIMLEGTFGHYIWRAAAHNEKAYLCGRRKIDFEVLARGEPRKVESLMLESDDGLIWRKRATFQQIDGDETAFLFEKDGVIKAIGRRGSKKAQMLTASSPYYKWERTELSEYVGGPNIQKWGGRYIVAGRQNTDRGAKTSFYWLHERKLNKFAELPSGGDNSYPGFIALSDKQAVVSWYSSHENIDGKSITAIYMANLTIE